jgi:hypothetical protein
VRPAGSDGGGAAAALMAPPHSLSGAHIFKGASRGGISSRATVVVVVRDCVAAKAVESALGHWQLEEVATTPLTTKPSAWSKPPWWLAVARRFQRSEAQTLRSLHEYCVRRGHSGSGAVAIPPNRPSARSTAWPIGRQIRGDDSGQPKWWR